MALGRFVRAVHAIAIELPGPDVGEITVPNEVRALAHLDALRFERVVGLLEQAQLDGFGVLGEEGEVHSLPVPRGPLRIGAARPHPHYGLTASVRSRVNRTNECGFI